MLRSRREPLDALTVHPRGPFVGGDLAPRNLEGRRPDGLVNQRKPLASFDALVERRRHALCPDRSFRPIQAGIVGLWSLLILRAFRFLPPFPRNGFATRPSRGSRRIGTMKALTPAALTPDGGSPRFLRLAFPTFHPQPR